MTTNSKIRRWYMESYKDDELGEDINPDVTFGQIWNAVKMGEDVYEKLGFADSVVRERVFQALAEIKHTDYESIYTLWLGNYEQRQRLFSKVTKKSA